MSRAEENLIRKYEAANRKRIASAAEKIVEDADLRYLLIALLEGIGGIDSSGMAYNPHTQNALTTAHETGKMAALQFLFNLCAEHAPNLYPDLIKEAIHERSQRTAAIARAGEQSARDSTN